MKTNIEIREELKRWYNIESANLVEIITHHATCPLYIPEMANKADKAYEYIQTLSKKTQKRLHTKINKITNAYYEVGENGESCYSMDQMFL